MPDAPRDRLFLVDGYALIYRAFFALIARPLRTRGGENTSAAWGVTSFLFRLLERQHPTYLAWVHDVGVSFRHQTYPDYKATREKLAEEQQQDFDRSLERIEEILAAFGVPVIGLEGFEADDVIGTLATQGVERGVEVVIVSGDKDFYQLIGPGIALLNPGRRGPAAVDEQWVDESNASERLGVPPARVTDFLALVGDSSDNVPGVKGVGEKTARELQRTFGDLDAILAHAAEIPGARARRAVEEHADLARLSRELVTIRRDVPLTLDLDAMRVGPPNRERLRQLFTELEFRSLLPKVEGAPVPPPPAQAESPLPAATTVPSVVVLATPDAVRAAVAACAAAPRTEVMVATSSSHPLRGRVVGVALAAAGQSWYVPFAHEAPDGELAGDPPPVNLPPLESAALRPLRDLLADPAVPKATHDSKFARLALRRAGVTLAGVVQDTMLASFVLDPGRRSHALEDIAQDRLGMDLPTYAGIAGKGRQERPFARIAVTEAARYCGARTRAVAGLCDAFQPELEDHALAALLGQIELPLVEVLADMEWRGVLVDRGTLGEIAREFGASLGELEREIYRAAGTEFNINSTPQLRTILFEKHQLPVLKRTKTGASTDYEVLEQLAAMGHEVPRLLIEYRELAKLKSTYVDALPGYINPETGRIHTSFNQTGASTGRLSSSDPNLQNIPIRTARGESIRRAFVAPPHGRLMTADYSQIELRLLAHLSGDPAFVDAFARGGDIHRQTAAVIFGVAETAVTADMRARAKTINFATIYGQGPFALSRQLGITQEEAKQFIRQYFERFSGVRAWLDRTIEEARDRGYVETLFGRRRYVPEIHDRNFNVRSFAERTATNSPLQGSAADLIKIAMIRIHRGLAEAGLAACMVLQVHDELVLEVPDTELDAAQALVKREMEAAADLRVPLVVSLGSGRDWVDAKA